jgi:hypothetical protein
MCSICPLNGHQHDVDYLTWQIDLLTNNGGWQGGIITTLKQKLKQAQNRLANNQHKCRCRAP